MKVDILLRTRDYDRDYRWIFKPEYVDRVTEDKMSFLIQMMQKSELKQYLENESLYNLYYLYDENGSALCARDSGVFAAVFTAWESGGGVFHSLYLVFHHHIGIDCGGADVGVPQQRLCGLDVAYSRLHERGECVACHVEMDIFCDSHFLGNAFQ